ncbi:YgjV family protein [Psychromonas sp. RZ22]|uniref:YgjV family protein n=1 Tax=Psychromonas algarum TaxID=2555643 RepID=UPI0010681204|nr:YgjV family protein [Psychromonas sp. RZ22]TEW54661.1 YgjV family protein [Psychromonas sp. RZ22]
MIDQHVIAQTLGFVSYALGVYAFYQKDDKKLKIVMLIFNVNHLLHFILMGSIVSAMSALLSAVRTGTAIYVSSKRVAAFFILVGLASGLYLADSIWDMWSIFGVMIGTYAVFVLKGIPMRIAFILGAMCWLTNNILIGSIGGTLLEATLISINLVTIVRLLREQRQADKILESH